LAEFIDIAFIQPSKSPYAMPILFKKKKDTKELRMCLDYIGLKKKTMKNQYPLPLVVDFFDKLAKDKVFLKLDLQYGYYQMQILEGDEVKTVIVTMYGSFEVLLMPLVFPCHF
jgi:hypothetical protein